MPSSSDILAGRAAVELFVDKSAIAPGMDAAAADVSKGLKDQLVTIPVRYEQKEEYGPPKPPPPPIDEAKLDAAVKKMKMEARPTLDELARGAHRVSTGIESAGRNANGTLRQGLSAADRITHSINRNLSLIRAGMVVNQLAVGIQDFAVVLEMTGDWNRAMSAAYNNVIQLFSLMSPWAGAIAAAAIAGYQLYNIFSKSATDAKRIEESTKKIAENVKESAKSAEEQYERGTIATVKEADQAEDKGWKEVEKIDAQIEQLQKDRNAAMSDWGKAGNDPQYAERAKIRVQEIDKKTNELLAEKQKKEQEIAQIQQRKNELAPGEADAAAYEEQKKQLIEQQKARQKIADDAQKEAAREDERLTKEEESKRERDQKEHQQKNDREVEAIRAKIETPDEKARKELDTVAHHEYWGRISPEEAARARDSISKEKDKANKLLNAADEGQQRVRGTFSGSALGGLGTGTAERQLKASEQAAKNTGDTATAVKELRDIWKFS